MPQKFITYEIYDNYNDYKKIKINDAIKVTLYPQNESFWASVKEILNINNKLLFKCCVENEIIRECGFSYNDIIYLKPEYIKEYKKCKDRFKISADERLRQCALIKQFIETFKRKPTIIEVEELCAKY